ncbi:MAG: 2-oxoglutarate dehydrogenase E1 component [Alphaproteobacteria bacterium CG_4_10_14_0_8_um_filter_53_9]|nr:MAG: 2-oxoglutarate dehydrogenase E1 component [Alphaproteobacteria bacterium CG_4_10_14_0_8_um_filter_53_9]
MHPVFDSSSLPLVEEMFAKYSADKTSVSEAWQAYFSGWLAAGDVASIENSAEGEACGISGDCDKAMRLATFMRAWRKWGHVAAKTDPLEEVVEIPYALTPEAFKLTEADLDAGCKAVRARYSGTVGAEIGAINDPAERAWAIKWWEGDNGEAVADAEVRKKLLTGLVEANALETFLHKKFVGVKRFSAEGTEASVVMVNWMIDALGAAGGTDVVMGMAHRGRLNALCHIVDKPYEDLMAAFAGTAHGEPGGPRAGDVKYHMGRETVRGGVTVRLLFNPSHLEAVNPMVLGYARALQDAAAGERTAVLPVLLHGDSAVAGQGVVAECNNMAPVKAYNVGGTIHIVVNNKVGFTANPEDAFGGKYCTDIFRSMGVPIIHVNADDMDACWRAARFAFEYRAEFGKDVVVDVVGYRRWGHNEGDDPTFTQPKVYAKVKNHAVAAEIYGKALVAGGVLADDEVSALEKAAWERLDAALEAAKEERRTAAADRRQSDRRADVPTKVGKDMVEKVAAAWAARPEGFTAHPKVGKVIDERVAQLKGEVPLNWGTAETAAYATLLMEGVGWRLTGQDVERGTFSHRHAVLTDAETDERWDPLAALAAEGAGYTVENSVLSENAVLGFEYGYALATKDKTLVMWEAQFGDFANGAQVVIDQFVASAKDKWGQDNRLAMLLPHGYEGQGPEHSSARIERFLQMCAEENMMVAYPSSPAQIFHLLRRQGLGSDRPLICFTPKSLLRLPQAISEVSDLVRGAWMPVIGDAAADPKKVKTVCLCTGKIYYDLMAKRDELGREDVALVRVEQLYPWPAAEIAAEVAKYKAKGVIWVQEEPKNMGAWSHVREYWGAVLDALRDEKYLRYAGRGASASPAVGTMEQHKAEVAEIMEGVFGE